MMDLHFADWTVKLFLNIIPYLHAVGFRISLCYLRTFDNAVLCVISLFPNRTQLIGLWQTSYQPMSFDWTHRSLKTLVSQNQKGPGQTQTHPCGRFIGDKSKLLWQADLRPTLTRFIIFQFMYFRCGEERAERKIWVEEKSRLSDLLKGFRQIKSLTLATGVSSYLSSRQEGGHMQQLLWVSTPLCFVFPLR